LSQAGSPTKPQTKRFAKFDWVGGETMQRKILVTLLFIFFLCNVVRVLDLWTLIFLVELKLPLQVGRVIVQFWGCDNIRNTFVGCT
jgi:hypothetical protein